MKEDSDTTTADPVWNKLIATLDFKDMISENGFTSFDPSSLAVLNGKARKLPRPTNYPLLPRHGDRTTEVTVKVRVVIDKDGNVIEAKGVSGNSSFFESAVDAAKQAKFLPTFICGELQEKRSGFIIYTFH